MRHSLNRQHVYTHLRLDALALRLLLLLGQDELHPLQTNIQQCHMRGYMLRRRAHKNTSCIHLNKNTAVPRVLIEAQRMSGNRIRPFIAPASWLVVVV